MLWNLEVLNADGVSWLYCKMKCKNTFVFHHLWLAGNHEYYTGEVDQWFAYLQSELGFTVLHNSHVNIANQFGDSFCLAGTDDIEARQMPYVDFKFVPYLILLMAVTTMTV